MDERLSRLAEHVRRLTEAEVRRTVFYDRVAHSLRATVGEALPVRRAKALAYLLDRVELPIHPHELIAGSPPGIWPIATGLRPYSELRREASWEVSPRLPNPVAHILTKRRADAMTASAVRPGTPFRGVIPVRQAPG